MSMLDSDMYDQYDIFPEKHGLMTGGADVETLLNNYINSTSNNDPLILFPSLTSDDVKKMKEYRSYNQQLNEVQRERVTRLIENAQSKLIQQQKDKISNSIEARREEERKGNKKISVDNRTSAESLATTYVLEKGSFLYHVSWDVERFSLIQLNLGGSKQSNNSSNKVVLFFNEIKYAVSQLSCVNYKHTDKQIYPKYMHVFQVDEDITGLYKTSETKFDQYKKDYDKVSKLFCGSKSDPNSASQLFDTEFNGLVFEKENMFNSYLLCMDKLRQAGNNNSNKYLRYIRTVRCTGEGSSTSYNFTSSGDYQL